MEYIEFNDIWCIGLMGNIDKKWMMMSVYKWNVMIGKVVFYFIYLEDLKFKMWNEVIKLELKVVVLVMMDMSGLMGIWEKYMVWSFFFWMICFLCMKYEIVEIEFIVYYIEVKVVLEEDFFFKGESGGIICLFVYWKVFELIN